MSVLVSKELREERHDICKENECGVYIKVIDLCGSCKCLMQAKTWMKIDPVESMKQGRKIETKCPKGLW